MLVGSTTDGAVGNYDVICVLKVAYLTVGWFVRFQLGYTPLLLASYQARQEIAEWLVSEKGCNPLTERDNVRVCILE